MLQHTICFYTEAGTLRGPSLSLECRHLCVHRMPILWNYEIKNFSLLFIMQKSWRFDFLKLSKTYDQIIWKNLKCCNLYLFFYVTTKNLLLYQAWHPYGSYLEFRMQACMCTQHANLGSDYTADFDSPSLLAEKWGLSYEIVCALRFIHLKIYLQNNAIEF